MVLEEIDVGEKFTFQKWNDLVDWIKSGISSKNVASSDDFKMLNGLGYSNTDFYIKNISTGTEEIVRIPVKSDEKIEIWRLSVRLDGGGTDPDVNVVVKDSTGELASTDDILTGDRLPVAETQEGDDLVVECQNDTGSTADVSILVLYSVV